MNVKRHQSLGEESCDRSLYSLFTRCLLDFSGRVNGPACLISPNTGQLCSLLCNWQICCFDAPESGFKRKKNRSDHKERSCTNWNNVSPRCWNTVLCSSENPIKQSKVLNSKANMLLCAVGRVRHSGSDPTYPSC